MLLVIYNSNPHNNPNLKTEKGWSLYRPEDWAALCELVDNYFFYLPAGDAMLENKSAEYLSYDEWLADYQVSEVDINKFTAGFQLIDILLGTTFYVPDIATQPDNDPAYPEMDAYA